MDPRRAARMSDPWLTLNLVLPATIAAVGTAGALVVAAATGRFGRRAPTPLAAPPAGSDQDGAQPPAAARAAEQDADVLPAAARHAAHELLLRSATAAAHERDLRARSA